MPADTPTFPPDLYARLIKVLFSEHQHRIAGRVDAALDAAEALFALVVLSTDQHAAIVAELRAGLDGGRGYEPKHVVRAIRILALDAKSADVRSAKETA